MEAKNLNILGLNDTGSQSGIKTTREQPESSNLFTHAFLEGCRSGDDTGQRLPDDGWPRQIKTNSPVNEGPTGSGTTAPGSVAQIGERGRVESYSNLSADLVPQEA